MSRMTCFTMQVRNWPCFEKYTYLQPRSHVLLKVLPVVEQTGSQTAGQIQGLGILEYTLSIMIYNIQHWNNYLRKYEIIFPVQYIGEFFVMISKCFCGKTSIIIGALHLQFWCLSLPEILGVLYRLRWKTFR